MSSTLEPFFIESDKIKINECTTMNHMGMQNFTLSSISQLKIFVTSWFLGEPTYYTSSGDNKKDFAQLNKLKNVNIEEIEKLYLIQKKNHETTLDLFKKIITQALDEDFEGVLKLAVEGRNSYNMRSGPVAIIFYAAMHSQRKIFNAQNPLKFREYTDQVIKIPTDAWFLFELYQKTYQNKNKFPTILKKCISKHLEKIEKYQMKKYLHKAHLIDLIRITHPRSSKNKIIEEVVKTGDLLVDDNEQTWEKLRSEKKSWKEIITILNTLPHMALLRNLVGIAKDTNDPEYLNNIIVPMLKKGVKYGKQLPFRYMTCYEEVGKLEDNSCKKILLDGVSNCIEIAMENFPILEGKTLCLVDNSGSAHGSFPSQYGVQSIAKIGNLSGVMTAKQCTGKGVVGVFGDRLVMIDIDKNKNVLDQVNQIHKEGKEVGRSTENGIWVFFKESFEEATNLKPGTDIELMDRWFDNIMIYSDQQAGCGGLYGSNPKEYSEYVVANKYVNVLKLIEKYRKLVNPKVNIYSVQIAGYNNSLVPEILYRTHLLTGWNGNECKYAYEMNKLMDELDEI